MTLREELYKTAMKVKEEKKLEEERKHFVFVENYLRELCREAAKNGDFEVLVKKLELRDGKNLTDEDVKKFASCYELDFKYDSDYTLPILSFNTAEKNDK